MIPREILKNIRQIELHQNRIEKRSFIFCLVLIVSSALAALLTSCAKDNLQGWWEVDVDATLAQYDKVPPGWEPRPLAEYQNYLREELAGRAYKFTGSRPQKPDWGKTNFQGSVEIRREGKMKFYGAWRIATNQPGAYEVFVYALNSGASYWPAGNIRMGTNDARALWYQDPGDKPLVLCKK